VAELCTGAAATSIPDPFHTEIRQDSHPISPSALSSINTAEHYWVVVLFGALDDVVDVERLLGRKEYVVYNINIRLTLRLWRRGFAVFRSAQGTQGTELGQCCIFQDINEVNFVQWVHNAKKRLVTGHNMEYE
jgi:hypothetical protein